MSAIVSCPECRRALQVPDEFFGKKVQCPDCKQMFMANPGEAPTPGAIQIAPATSPSAAPLPPRDATPHEAGSDRRHRDEDDLDDLRVGDRLHSGEPERGAIILTLGIVSLVLSVFSFILYILPAWILPMALGIVGWIMGHRDLRAIRGLGRRHQQSTNYVLTLIGMILSIVGVGISALVMLFSCAMIALFGFAIFMAANAPPPPGPRPR
jgi:hypothetical protein